jgi:hypothetical protein
VAAFPHTGYRYCLSFRMLSILNRFDFAWVLVGANHKSVGVGGRGNSAERIRQATALDRLTVSRWGKARTAMAFGLACSLKVMRVSAAEKPVACWARTTTTTSTTTDMNASEEVTWVL